MGFAGTAFMVVSVISCGGRESGLRDPEPAPPPFPSDFQPLPPLSEPLPPPADKPGLAYLRRIHTYLAKPWATFLENCRLRLPPGHALNDSLLATRISLAIGRDGSLQAAKFTLQSGERDFDQAALEIVRDAAPFPEPPREFISDDENVYIEWFFARDRRQAGVATAELRRIEWEARRAVPKFLAAGDVSTAARRLARDLSNGVAGKSELYLELGRAIAVAAIREALRDRDIGTQRMGVVAATVARVLAAAPELRQIIQSSVDVALRGEAIAAIGAIGDQGAGPLLVEIMETAKGSGVGGSADNSAAAARALAAIGKRDIAEATVLGWLEAPDRESKWAALVVMAEFSVPAAVPILAGFIADSSQPRPVRIASCVALGTSTTIQAASRAMKGLRRGFSESDAGVRAACVRGVVAAAQGRVRSRMTYWSAVELMKTDRDERVRAAAVLAAAYLEPARFYKELYILRREKSKLVLAALARSLAVAHGAEAVKLLVRLSRDDDPTVRRYAAASLLERKEAWAQDALAQLVIASDPEVRLAAVRVVDDATALAAFLDDPSPVVRSAAFGSIVRVRGRLATLPQLANMISESTPGSAVRPLWAMNWLNPRGQ
ncbi:MAG: TonB family protein [Proteobacteria bacterium]|nr:TonB family protein [Pseudomonadota bacterium]